MSESGHTSWTKKILIEVKDAEKAWKTKRSLCIAILVMACVFGLGWIFYTGEISKNGKLDKENAARKNQRLVSAKAQFEIEVTGMTVLSHQGFVESMGIGLLNAGKTSLLVCYFKDFNGRENPDGSMTIFAESSRAEGISFNQNISF